MNTNDFDFHLPEELIAQTPLEARCLKTTNPQSTNRSDGRPAF